MAWLKSVKEHQKLWVVVHMPTSLRRRLYAMPKSLQMVTAVVVVVVVMLVVVVVVVVVVVRGTWWCYVEELTTGGWFHAKERTQRWQCFAQRLATGELPFLCLALPGRGGAMDDEGHLPLLWPYRPLLQAAQSRPGRKQVNIRGYLGC